jgi:hypothetical protein
MRTVFLTRRRTTILWPRIRHPHVVARLTSPIIRGIFARRRTIHVPPIVLWTIHLMPVILRTSNLAVHCPIVHMSIGAIVHASIRAIVHVAVGTVIHAMVGYRPRCNHIVPAELSGT